MLMQDLTPRPCQVKPKGDWVAVPTLPEGKIKDGSGTHMGLVLGCLPGYAALRLTQATLATPITSTTCMTGKTKFLRRMNT